MSKWLNSRPHHVRAQWHVLLGVRFRGHPDKLADRISDAVLDEFLRHDPKARVACETLLADQTVVVAGEFKTRTPEVFRAVRERVVTASSLQGRS